VHLVVSRPRLEAAASATLGMDVTIGATPRVGLLPGPVVTLHDVRVQNRGAEVAAAEEARLEVRVAPLLRGEVRIASIALRRARISIEREPDGSFNFEPREAGPPAWPALELARVTATDAVLRYEDKRSGGGFTAAGCRLFASPLRVSGGEGTLWRNLSLAGEVACRELRLGALVVSDLGFSVSGRGGVLELEPVRMGVFGGRGSGRVRADFSGPVPRFHVRGALAGFRFDEFLRTLSARAAAKGTVDCSADLTMEGSTAAAMKRTLDGEISLRGANLTLEGSDLDRQFSRFEASQNFNLVDVGAFFFAGPLGLAVTKGYNFAGLLEGSGGSSEIRTLVSNWKLTGGVAQAGDVAMATREYRVALQGRLNFVDDRFDDVTVAMIDRNGCARVRQKIRGPFREPVVEKPNILASLAGPALNLLKKARAILPGKPCEPFYSGSVAAPR
jgi:uncharacterized protein involved in outer membrane biogenesis